MRPSAHFIIVNKNTDDLKLIWRAEPDKRGLPLDGVATDRHFTFYFAGLKADIFKKLTKKLLKVFLNNLKNYVPIKMPWQTRTHYCGHIVAHDVSCARKRGTQI